MLAGRTLIGIESIITLEQTRTRVALCCRHPALSGVSYSGTVAGRRGVVRAPLRARRTAAHRHGAAARIQAEILHGLAERQP